VLQEVIRQAPAEYVTVGWLTSTLHRNSFGIIMLCLGLLATIPVGSSVAGLILAIMAVQLISGRQKAKSSSPLPDRGALRQLLSSSSWGRVVLPEAAAMPQQLGTDAAVPINLVARPAPRIPGRATTLMGCPTEPAAEPK
jgi:hypothetical protein